MALVHIEPSDLSPTQAQQVLDFLNRMTSAQEIDLAIDFPDIPDIGERLSQRLFDARTALGGSYTSIDQIRSVRLIGPARFTEICVAALGLDPTRWVDLFYGAAPMGLRTETGLAVTLDVRPRPAWLGQQLALTVRVADLGGTPRGGVAVTVHTGAGRLVWMYGYQRFEGEAVTVLTGVDGSAELDLIRDPSEPLSDVQQAALEHALAPIDVNAGDPLKLEADFRALAALYLNERSYNLRRAIDIHVRDRRDAMVASINPGTWRLTWPIDSVLLQADALSTNGGGSTVSRAVTTVLWKNWVGAWLEFFGDVLRERGNLDQQFGPLVAKAKGSEVLIDLLAKAQTFVAGQSGRTALWLGQKAVESAMSKLTSGDLSKLNDDARDALLTQLETASKDVSPTSLGSFTLVTGVSKTLNARLKKIGNLSFQAIDHVDAVATKVDGQAAHVDQVAAQVSQLSAQSGSDFTAFSTNYAKFNLDIAKFNLSSLGLTNQLGGLQNSVSTLQLNVQSLQQRSRAPPVAGTAPKAGPKKTKPKRGGA